MRRKATQRPALVAYIRVSKPEKDTEKAQDSASKRINDTLGMEAMRSKTG